LLKVVAIGRANSVGSVCRCLCGAGRYESSDRPPPT
jgi:hypothetical protein